MLACLSPPVPAQRVATPIGRRETNSVRWKQSLPLGILAVGRPPSETLQPDSSHREPLYPALAAPVMARGGHISPGLQVTCDYIRLHARQPPA